MIFDKTLRVESSALDNAEAITLMSADIDRITSSMHLVHELYASVIETGIALWLLYNFLGVAMVAPIAWILSKPQSILSDRHCISKSCAVCLLAGVPLARASGNAQVPWLEAIEERLASTAKALGAMKAIKMTGLADIIAFQIANLRIAEVRASLRHRTLNIFVAIACKSIFRSKSAVLSRICLRLVPSSCVFGFGACLGVHGVYSYSKSKQLGHFNSRCCFCYSESL